MNQSNRILPSALRVADTFKIYPDYNKEYTVYTAFECVDNFDKKTIRVKTVEGPIFILDPIKTVYYTGINLEPFRKTFIADLPEYYDLEDCHTEEDVCLVAEVNAIIRESYSPLHALMSDLFILDQRNNTGICLELHTTDKGCYLSVNSLAIFPISVGYLVEGIGVDMVFEKSESIYGLIQSIDRAIHYKLAA